MNLLLTAPFVYYTPKNSRWPSQFENAFYIIQTSGDLWLAHKNKKETFLFKYVFSFADLPIHIIFKVSELLWLLFLTASQKSCSSHWPCVISALAQIPNIIFWFKHIWIVWRLTVEFKPTALLANDYWAVWLLVDGELEPAVPHGEIWAKVISGIQFSSVLFIIHQFKQSDSHLKNLKMPPNIRKYQTQRFDMRSKRPQEFQGFTERSGSHAIVKSPTT